MSQDEILHEIPKYSIDHSCLKLYVDDGCWINEEIRDYSENDRDRKVQATCTRINELFKNVKLNQDLTLYRGITSPLHLKHAGYTSTSLQFIQARDFIGRDGIVLHIRIPAGQVFQAIKILSNKEHADEDEVLFPCNTEFENDAIPTDLKQFNYSKKNNEIVWNQNENVKIMFVKLKSDTANRGGAVTIQRLRMCATSKEYQVRRLKNGEKYILVNRCKVFLKTIRGKYRYISESVSGL